MILQLLLRISEMPCVNDAHDPHEAKECPVMAFINTETPSSSLNLDVLLCDNALEKVSSVALRRTCSDNLLIWDCHSKILCGYIWFNFNR